MLMMLLLLVLEKSMSRWHSKTPKLGGLPNCTHEPRKLVSLCVMLNNAAECNVGAIFCNGVVQNPDNNQGRSIQKTKPFFLMNNYFSS